MDARQWVRGASGMQIDLAGAGTLDTRISFQIIRAFFDVEFGAFSGKNKKNIKKMCA